MCKQKFCLSLERVSYYPGMTSCFDVWRRNLRLDVFCRTASYYDVTVDGNTVQDVAWYYPKPLDKAKTIEGYVAFYKVSSVFPNQMKTEHFFWYSE